MEKTKHVAREMVEMVQAGHHDQHCTCIPFNARSSGRYRYMAIHQKGRVAMTSVVAPRAAVRKSLWLTAVNECRIQRVQQGTIY